MNQETYGTMYYVDDMNAAVAFYKKNLALQPSFESPEWTEFSIGGHNLCLHSKQLGENYRENGILIVKANGIKELYSKMQRDGLNVRDLSEVHPGHWSFGLEDPSHNEVSFYGTP